MRIHGTSDDLHLGELQHSANTNSRINDVLKIRPFVKEDVPKGGSGFVLKGFDSFKLRHIAIYSNKIVLGWVQDQGSVKKEVFIKSITKIIISS